VSYIELDKNAYFHNLKVISKKLGSVDKLSVVLKDNAYGHGLLEMASLASEFGIKRAIVRHLSEAKLIGHCFENILILAPSLQIENNSKFSYVINDLIQIKNFPKGISVHLKVDTGMHRHGVSIDEVKEAIELISKYKLSLDGVMTHFRSADELSSELYWQQKIWEDVKKEVLVLTKKRPLFHSANSAAVLRLQNYKDDFARCGISTFGYHQMPSSFIALTLKPVLSLWATKITTRVLKRGQRVGYGGAYIAKNKTIISSYDIGYGDGFFRYINKFGFIGKVSMDSCIKEGDADKICLIGNASLIANDFSTISYDVLTKLSSSIRRVVV
jgi:alanine racemase